jgi:hypothetical protein
MIITITPGTITVAIITGITMATPGLQHFPGDERRWRRC